MPLANDGIVFRASPLLKYSLDKAVSSLTLTDESKILPVAQNTTLYSPYSLYCK